MLFRSPNITKITLEEGLTIVPEYLCANTGITEIIIPNSVIEIGSSAFENCTKLKKITILDNVKKMGFDDTSDNESIFKNNNNDMIIYCYEDSIAADYAQKYNIKYEYLTKPSTPKPEKDEGEDLSTDLPTNAGKDNTVAPTGKLPFAGTEIGITCIVVALIGGAVYAYIRYKNLKGI